MARDKAFREAEKKIEEARRSKAAELDLSSMKLTELPDSLGQLTQLRELNLEHNQLTTLPEWLGQLTQLRELNLGDNQLATLPEWLGQLTQLQTLFIHHSHLTSLPQQFANFTKLEKLVLNANYLGKIPEVIRYLTELRILYIFQNGVTSAPAWLGQLEHLKEISLYGNDITDIPVSLAQLEHLKTLNLKNNPLNPELAAAYEEGLDAVKRYLRAKAEAQVVLNEAKLILVGEGEVGKSCLLGALRGEEWVENRLTTHGIEIKPVEVVDPDSGRQITLNGWDFGGQRVYRPTHQLFFSAPAVYLVVWKPREGPQQGFVKEWIKLVKHREPEAKILVVATHGGPGQRQPDIDKQELWDLFGKDTVLDFFHVDSKPNKKTGECRGIAQLKEAIARVAAGLPEMGRSVPARWQQAREALKQTGAAYLSLEQALAICREHKMDDEARLFVTISHRLGHLIYYEHDPALRDIVVLTPGWLATAMSFVFDDQQTRDGHGLVSFARLGQLWDDPTREEEFRYPPHLHPVFLRLMERFDLSYRVAGLHDRDQVGETSLIAQLVPDVRPDPIGGWAAGPAMGDEQQVQICRIVDAKNGQSATAQGLFYQLIVRLHRYSLGRINHNESVHWQRGLVLDDDYNGRALLEHVGDDVRITVRAAYPERLLSMLTYEVKWLVESFWAGLRCDVMVPCIAPCGKATPGTGLFEVQKLIESKRRRRPEYPCPVCNEWQDIDFLLRNAPAIRPMPAQELLAEFVEIKRELTVVRTQLIQQRSETLGTIAQADAVAANRVPDQNLLLQLRDFFATHFSEDELRDVCFELEIDYDDLPGAGRAGKARELVMRYKRHGRISELITIGRRLRPGIALSDAAVSTERLPLGSFDRLEAGAQRRLSQVDDAFSGLMQALTDEAKDGPRLFSLVPVNRTRFNPKQWSSAKFRLTLWCEHSRLPLPALNGEDDKRGIYELEITREWFKKAAPFLKLLGGTLRLVLPVAATKLFLDDATYKLIEEDLDFGQACIESTIEGGEKIGGWLGRGDASDLEHGEALRAQGGILRELHGLFKKVDLGFGGLVRVQNKRQEFMWVHSQFEQEY